MAIVIEESGMKLGPYDDDNVFHIEKSTVYTSELMQNGCKTCELVLYRNGTLLFIEAKTSCPKQPTDETEAEKRRKYCDYIDDIVTKMRHSLTLYINILLARLDTNDVPDTMRSVDLSNIEIKPILIVKNAQKEWLIPLADKLESVFKPEMHIWKCRKFWVINEETAIKKYLLLNEI